MGLCTKCGNYSMFLDAQTQMCENCLKQYNAEQEAKRREQEAKERKSQPIETVAHGRDEEWNDGVRDWYNRD